MTEEQRKRATGILLLLAGNCQLSPLGKEDMDACHAYQAEYERMRQFIRNLADESRVYLESEE